MQFATGSIEDHSLARGNTKESQDNVKFASHVGQLS